ncbi:MAG: hypothetical protein R2792_07890 [Saprospiraceae bacterium]
MTKTVRFLSLVSLVVLALVFSNCKKSTDTQTELITDVELRFTHASGFDQTFTWSDPDGDGGNAPVIDDIVLPVSLDSLHCSIQIWDRSKTPAVNITEEILQEADDHLFVFNIDLNANVLIVYADADTQGNSLGLKTNWITPQAGTTTLRLVLYHEPTNKSNFLDPGGEVDVDVSFPLIIQ